jgi:hypothetical protein
MLSSDRAPRAEGERVRAVRRLDAASLCAADEQVTARVIVRQMTPEERATVPPHLVQRGAHRGCSEWPASARAPNGPKAGRVIRFLRRAMRP